MMNDFNFRYIKQNRINYEKYKQEMIQKIGNNSEITLEEKIKEVIAIFAIFLDVFWFLLTYL